MFECVVNIDMDTQPSDQAPGREGLPSIEGFRLICKLGHGRTTSVWKAEQISLNRLVVIKILLEHLSREHDDVERFKTEAMLAANLKHAGIVQVYDFGQSRLDQRYYFVMEYISGYTIGDWLRRKKRIAELDSLIVAHGVADALKFAWDQAGIIHCDIKPDNIMVDGDGTVKVTDLGLAQAVRKAGMQPERRNEDEVIVTGTPNYMSPEQAHGDRALDCRTDIYAMGASLYHMVTGHLPFADSPPDVVMERQMHEELPDPRELNPELSLTMAEFIQKMIAKDMLVRFQTWSEVLTEIVRMERVLRERTQSAREAPSAKSAVSASVAAATPAAQSPSPDVARFCTSCGKPIEGKMRYCAFCGKHLAGSAKSGAARVPHAQTIRLKPIENAPVNADVAPAALEIKRPSALRRRFSFFMDNVRMVFSLLLILFLLFYGYQLLVKENDIMMPIKEAAVERFLPLLGGIEESLLNCGESLQEASRKMWADFKARPRARPAPREAEADSDALPPSRPEQTDPETVVDEKHAARRPDSRVASDAEADAMGDWTNFGRASSKPASPFR